MPGSGLADGAFSWSNSPFPSSLYPLLPVSLGVNGSVSDAGRHFTSLKTSPTPSAWGGGQEWGTKNPPLMKYQPSEHQERRPKARGGQKNWITQRK